MLVAVFSDSHGEMDAMCAAIDEHHPDVVLHLGDYCRDADDLRRLYPNLDIRSVRGNCDALDYGDNPEQLRFRLEQLEIFMVHGHRHSVKTTPDPIANATHFSGAKLGLFGHTHMTEYRVMGNVVIFNPGSVGRGRRTYGLITVKGADFQCRIMDV